MTDADDAGLLAPVAANSSEGVAELVGPMPSPRRPGEVGLVSPRRPGGAGLVSSPRRAGAVGLVLAALLSGPFGGAVAALLFPRVGVDGVVTLRLTIAALVLLAVCRPRVRGYRRADWLLIGGFGAALAGMNTLAYHAIALIPLGTVVMLEVLGPLVLSVVTARRAASWLWAGLAAAGVAVLSGAGFDRLTPAGIGFAAAAGAVWAGYIMASARVGQRFPRTDGLALAMTAAAVITLPLGAGTAGTALLQPDVLARGAAVALLSSALPYALEMLALRRMPTATFAVLMSLGPAVAALAGYLVLHQRLTPVEGLAIAMVIAANVGAVRTPARPAAPRENGGPAPAAPPRGNVGPTPAAPSQGDGGPGCSALPRDADGPARSVPPRDDSGPTPATPPQSAARPAAPAAGTAAGT